MLMGLRFELSMFFLNGKLQMANGKLQMANGKVFCMFVLFKTEHVGLRGAWAKPG